MKPLCKLLVLLSLCMPAIACGGEDQLSLKGAESLLSDIDKDRDGVIQKRIAGLLQKYEDSGLTEKFSGPILSFMAACSAKKMVEIEESMTAGQLVEYANDAHRSKADDDRIATECLEDLALLMKAKQQ